MPARRYGPYELIRQLGAGELGKVYLARDPLRHTEIALKQVQGAHDNEKRAAFLKSEYGILAKLRHPNLVRVYDLGLEEGNLYFTSEYINGVEIGQAVSTLSLEQKLELIAQLCRALEYIHSRGIIHGDIKPSNILITQKSGRRTLKLLDFGLARHFKTHPCQPGGGTRAYMAPEVLRGRITPQSDLYALGVVLDELIPTKRPSPLDELVQKLMSPQLENRFSRANTVIRALNRCVSANFSMETIESLESYLYSPELIGRRESYDQLWQAVSDSVPRFVMLSGEFGIGKTRLIDEIKTAAQLQNIPVITADSLPSLLQQLRLPAFPELADADESESFQQMVQLINSTLAKEKYLFHITDLNQLSLTEIKFLKFWVRQALEGSCPICWIGELRGPGLAALQDIPAVETLVLLPFTRAEVATYLEHITAQETIDRKFISAIHQLSAGVPAALTAILKQLIAQQEKPDQLQLDLAALSQIKQVPDISDALRQHYDTLTANEQKLLTFMALWQSPVDFAASKQLLGWDESKLFDAAAALLKNRMITQGQESFELIRPLWRKSLSEQISANSRRHWHSKIAQYIEPSVHKRQTWLLPALAQHYLESGDREKGPHYAFLAAQCLQRQFFNEQALHYYKQGIERAGGNFFDEKIYTEMARLYERLGRFKQAHHLYQEIAEHLRDTAPEQSLQAEIHQALASQKQGNWKDALKAYEQLLHHSSQQLSSKQAMEIYSLTAMIQARQGQLDAAWSTIQKGLKLTEHRQHRGSAVSFNTAALICYYRGQYEQAITYYQRSLKSYEAQKSEAGIANVYNNLGMVYQQEHNANAALEYYQRALRIAKKRGNLPFQATLFANQATVYQERGEYASALTDYRRSEAIHRSMEMREEHCGDCINLANIYTIFGAAHEASSYIEQAQQNLEQEESSTYRGYLLSIQGDLALLNRDGHQAIRHYQDAQRCFEKTTAVREQRLMRLNQLRVLLLEGKLQSAEKIFKELLPPSAEEDSESALLYDLLAARLNIQKNEDLEETEHTLTKITRFLRTYPAPELAWDTHDALHELALKIGDLTKAHGHRLTAQDIIMNLARNVPEEFQNEYLQHPLRQQVTADGTHTIKAASKEIAMSEHTNHHSLKMTRLLEINRKLNSEWSLDKLLELIMDSAIELSGAKRGFLILSLSGRLRHFDWKQVRTARHFERANIEEDEIELSSSVVNQALNRQAVLLTSNAQDDTRFSKYQSVHRLELNSILVVPLIWESNVIGALYLDNASISDAFTDDDIPLVEMFAEFAVLALRNSKSFERLQITRRDAIRQSKALQKTVTQQNVEILQIQEQLRRTQQELPTRYNYENIIGRSKAMQDVFRVLDKVTDTNIPVIIYGESGTGKELIAKALHFNSSRKDKHFVSENCSAIPEHLLESELFGHVKGAFTGAEHKKEGLFQYADHGTLLLDEIGDMPVKLQPKLLRVLQENQIRPIGDRKTIPIDVRIIAASHRDLKLLVQQGRFRQDLFYRINGLIVRIPALRERHDDIPLLVEHFLAQYSSDSEPVRISAEAMKCLMQYSWPGNVRELEHSIRNAILFAESGEITTETLAFKEELFHEGTPLLMSRKTVDFEVPAAQQLEQLTDERERLLEALRLTHNHKTKAAQMLGVTRKTLYNWLERYEISGFIRN